MLTRGMSSWGTSGCVTRENAVRFGRTSRVTFGRECRRLPSSPCHQQTRERPQLAVVLRVHRPLPGSLTSIEGKRRVEAVITGRKDDWYRGAARLAVAGQRKAAAEHVHPMDDVSTGG